MAKYITYGSSNPNKLDPTTRIKYGILDEIVPNEVTRVTQQWGSGYAVYARKRWTTKTYV